MYETQSTVESVPPRGFRAVLLTVKFTGLMLLLGGFAALMAMWLLGPQPASLEEWLFLRRTVRVVFLACVFAGLIVTMVAGLGLYLRRRAHWHHQRWFLVKLAMIVVFVPPLHFWGRGRMLALDAALERGDLALAAQRWNEVGIAFVVALALLSAIALLGALRPGARASNA